MITSQDVTRAIATMKAIIPFFPTSELGIQIVQRSLESFVSTREQLEWLAHTACDNMRHFSLPELRGIFCTRFPPKDGQYANAETPGFTPDDQMASVEAAYHQREAEEFDRNLIDWKKEAKLLRGTEEPEPFELPPAAIKQIPAPKIIESQPAGEMRPSLREVEQQLQEDLAHNPSRSDEEKERLITELQRELSRAKTVNGADPD
jgi:hypothetical protein